MGGSEPPCVGKRKVGNETRRGSAAPKFTGRARLPAPHEADRLQRSPPWTDAKASRAC